MQSRSSRYLVCLASAMLLAAGLAAGARAQQSPTFTPGNLVVSVEGCGVYGGACTSVPNGTGGTGLNPGTSTLGGYGDNQAAPLTLFQFTPNGVSSVTYVNSLVFPQTGSAANLPVSGEYGSSSEASLQLSGNGLYLTIAGYGINANTFNASPNSYSPTPNAALAQSSSIPSSNYTAIPRVITLVDPYGNVNSSTPIYNIYNTNNPRSVYTADGVSNAWISGQGSGCDTTGGVFYVPLLKSTTAPTAITGGDASSGNTNCVAVNYTGPVYQDTRSVQVYGNTLYISVDSTEGKSDNRSFIGTLGTPPATSLFTPPLPQTSGYTTGPAQMSGFGNTGGTGKETMTAATGNGLNTGKQINISPEGFFFASPAVLYVADSGLSKQSSATSSIGDGGLQKWVNSSPDGSGSWSLVYTLSKGLNLVLNTSAAGTTGLEGITGKVVNGVAYLYATTFTINDLDPSYLYGISDTLTATTNPGGSFTQLAAAPADSNFKGVSFAPTLAAGSATITSAPSGLAVTTSGSGCAAGTYVTPFTLVWTPGSSCDLSVASPQTVSGTQYAFSQWQDGTTAATDAVTASSAPAVYSATFKQVPVVTFPTASSIIYGQPLSASTLSGGASSAQGTFAFTTPNNVPGAGASQQSVTFTPNDATDYATVTGSVSVTVAPAPLTVTANPASKTQGTANPAFTATITGFVNGDSSSVVSGAPAFSTTATTSSPVGTYPIVPSLGTLTAANYTFSTFVNGTLSVVNAPTIILTPSISVVKSGGAYVATITVTNTGTGAASGVTLTTATLGGVAGTGSMVVGNIAAGGTGSTTITYPLTAGADGARVAAAIAGTDSVGGAFTANLRVVLP